MKRMSIARLALCLVVLGLLAAPARADTLWYNGDLITNPNLYVGYQNQITPDPNTPTIIARTYAYFYVPAGGWTINSLYSNNLFDNQNGNLVITGASWEIWAATPPASGGNATYSGTSSFFGDPAATGRSIYGYPEFTVAVTGLNFPLGEGGYWLSVTPINSNASAFIAGSPTTGYNTDAVPTYVNAFYAENSYCSYSNSDGSLTFETVFNDNLAFSMGIEGTDPSAVPLPSSVLLLGFGLLAMGSHRIWVQDR